MQEPECGPTSPHCKFCGCEITSSRCYACSGHALESIRPIAGRPDAISKSVHMRASQTPHQLEDASSSQFQDFVSDMSPLPHMQSQHTDGVIGEVSPSLQAQHTSHLPNSAVPSIAGEVINEELSDLDYLFMKFSPHTVATSDDSLSTFPITDGDSFRLQPCNYVNTPSGCRRGNFCVFSHLTSRQPDSLREELQRHLASGLKVTRKPRNTPDQFKSTKPPRHVAASESSSVPGSAWQCRLQVFQSSSDAPSGQ
jgi:hypothetical protein